MKCERAVELLTQSGREGVGDDRWRAAEHADGCEQCRAAVAAVHALRVLGMTQPPRPSPDAVERAVAAAKSRNSAAHAPRSGFWAGLGIGAALAAGLAAAMVAFWPLTNSVTSESPSLVLALNDPRPVSISLTTPEALDDAEIHVVVSGAIDLGGYAGQRELRWRTNLDQGVNQLTLPIVATTGGTGQVLVEVLHQGKRRSFVVDVLAG